MLIIYRCMFKKKGQINVDQNYRNDFICMDHYKTQASDGNIERLPLVYAIYNEMWDIENLS